MVHRSKSRVSVVLALIAVVALAASPSFARGGRGGGGRGAGGGGSRNAGGARPSGGLSADNFTKNLGGQAGNLSGRIPGGQQLQGMLPQAAGQGATQAALNGRVPGSRNLQGTFQQQAGQFREQAQGQRNGETRQSAQDRAQQFQSGTEPFSAAWYADHPQAWQYSHPHADAAAVATAAGVAAWVGAAYYSPSDSSGSSTTVVYQEAPPEEATTTGSLPEQVSPNAVANTGEWMPLGTYSLVVSQNTPPTTMLQLAVDRAGQLSGVYYDSLTNTTQNIAGTLDRNTQQAQWSLENNPQLTFQAPLNELLKPTSTVNVNLATGQQQWQLVRVEDK